MRPKRTLLGPEICELEQNRKSYLQCKIVIEFAPTHDAQSTEETIEIYSASYNSSEKYLCYSLISTYSLTTICPIIVAVYPLPQNWFMPWAHTTLLSCSKSNTLKLSTLQKKVKLTRQVKRSLIYKSLPNILSRQVYHSLYLFLLLTSLLP